MAQSAEQAAAGNIPPIGETRPKKQFSADAFRALTERLNGNKQVTPEPPIHETPAVSVQPVPQPIPEIQAPCVSEQAIVPEQAFVPEQTFVEEVEPAPQTVDQQPTPPVFEDPVPCVPEHPAVNEFAEPTQEPVEVQQVEIPATEPIVEPVPQPQPQPEPEPVFEQVQIQEQPVVQAEYPSAPAKVPEPDLSSLFNSLDNGSRDVRKQQDETLVPAQSAPEAPAFPGPEAVIAGSIAVAEIAESKSEDALIISQAQQKAAIEQLITDAPPLENEGNTESVPQELVTNVETFKEVIQTAEQTVDPVVEIEQSDAACINETELPASDANLTPAVVVQVNEVADQMPVADDLDPLIAAMNLMQVSKAPEAFQNAGEVDVALSETALEAIANTPQPAIMHTTPLQTEPDAGVTQNYEIEAETEALLEMIAEPASSQVEPVIELETPVETEAVSVAETRQEINPEPVSAAVQEPVDVVTPEIVTPEQIVALEQSAAPAQEIKQTTTAVVAPVIGDAEQTPREFEPDAQAGLRARQLLDMMSAGGAQPHERALAADTLLQLVPRMMVRDLIPLAERVCMMEDAPPLLVKALINHKDSKVAAPLLEDGQVIVEQDLLRLITTTQVERLIMMAKRRIVTQTVCDALIARGEPSVYLTLVRNPGAALSHDAFVAFCEISKSQASLQAPLATRGDTPPPIAFELFWSLPVELRRYVLSRFLTDTATLDKILKITQSVEGDEGAERKFPLKRKIEEMVDLIAQGVTDKAVAMMAELAGINEDNARRIIADPDGEPLTVVLKTLGLPRKDLNALLKSCASSSKAMLRSDRVLSELQVMFDSLSFNKARTLLTYWDWAVEKTGPYSRRVM